MAQGKSLGQKALVCTDGMQVRTGRGLRLFYSRCKVPDFQQRAVMRTNKQMTRTAGAVLPGLTIYLFYVF